MHLGGGILEKARVACRHEENSRKTVRGISDFVETQCIIFIPSRQKTLKKTSIHSLNLNKLTTEVFSG